jgi:hypothetical protein
LIEPSGTARHSRPPRATGWNDWSHILGRNAVNNPAPNHKTPIT